jgi:agmatine deiminase
MLLPACALPSAEPQRAEDPGPPGFRLVGEYETVSAIWLSHGPGHDRLTAGLVDALMPHVALKFLVADEAAEHSLRALLATYGLTGAASTVVREPLASFFMRDMAVFTRGPQGQLGMLDLDWTQYGIPAWCQTRHTRAEDAAACSGDIDRSREGLDRAIARHAGAQVLHRSLLAVEGGGLESNGRGLLIANESLLLNRNPGRSLPWLETALLRLPGVQKVIWLPQGLAEDPHLRATITGDYVGWGTGGHTDEFVRFADARTVLLAWPTDGDAKAHPVARLTRARMQRNEQILQAATTIEGQPLRVLRVPMPKPINKRVFLSAAAQTDWPHGWTADFFPRAERRWQGQAVMQMAVASYLNFVLAPGVVVLPDYRAHGTPRAQQEAARLVFEQAFPDRAIKFVDAISANWVGGGLHCATLTEP